MDNYQIHLEQYEGPLDLLLFIIRKNDFNIFDIPIADITHEYLQYIDVMMKDLKLEMAGEFLVMASTLMRIKARQLLPAQEGEAPEEDPDLKDLQERLQEMAKYKQTAEFIRQRAEVESDAYSRGEVAFAPDDYTVSVSLFDLVEAYRKVLDDQQKRDEVKEIVRDEVTLEQMVRRLRDSLDGKKYILFQEIFRADDTRQHLVLMFIGMLELIRMREIAARQNKIFGEIRIYKRAEIPGEGKAASA